MHQRSWMHFVLLAVSILYLWRTGTTGWRDHNSSAKFCDFARIQPWFTDLMDNTPGRIYRNGSSYGVCQPANQYLLHVNLLRIHLLTQNRIISWTCCCPSICPSAAICCEVRSWSHLVGVINGFQRGIFTVLIFGDWDLVALVRIICQGRSYVRLPLMQRRYV